VGITHYSSRISKEEIERIFNSFANKRVLVIGDVMLDSYWWGKVDRISPEAPVPIVNISKREYRLGGAANVALNLKKLGADPVICSVIGRDIDGEVFLRLLAEDDISSAGITYSETRPTTVKTRVLGNKNQLLRIDTEEDKQISGDETLKLAERIRTLMNDADLIIFEDYDKGVISEELINEIVKEANSSNIPVAVDPKKRNFLSYRNVTLFKPNLRELAGGLKLDLDGASSEEEIHDAAAELQKRLQVKHSLITLSERGVYITEESGDGHLIPAHIRNIYDVSGAGDTVISVAALALMSNAPIETVAAIANLAGGLVCEKVGVVPIEKEELLQAALQELS
jgi:rfaE bifunctional protein kinase chain/domain